MEPEAKSRRWSSLFSERQTLGCLASDAGYVSIGRWRQRPTNSSRCSAPRVWRRTRWWCLLSLTSAECGGGIASCARLTLGMSGEGALDASDAAPRGFGQYWTASGVASDAQTPGVKRVCWRGFRPLAFERSETQWRASERQMLDATSVACAMDASGDPDQCITALFEGVPLYILIGRLWAPSLGTLTYLWAYWAKTMSSHLSPLISLHLIAIFEWDWVIQVHWSLLCIQRHLRDCFAAEFLVTLGGCRHLDDLEQRWRSGTCWWLSVTGSGDCLVRGSCGSLAERWIPTLVDCSCHCNS
jgi:hypothetical protein